MFGPGRDIFFRAREGSYGFAYRVREDGTGLQKVNEYPVIETRGSPRTANGWWYMGALPFSAKNLHPLQEFCLLVAGLRLASSAALQP